MSSNHPAATPPTAEQVEHLQELAAALDGPWEVVPWHIAEGPPHICHKIERWILCELPSDAHAELVTGLLNHAPTLLAALAPAERASPERVRHLKRGTTYGVAFRSVEVQTSRPIVEGDVLVVYVADSDGKSWARLPEEFDDGRFEPLTKQSITMLVDQEWFDRKMAELGDVDDACEAGVMHPEAPTRAGALDAAGAITEIATERRRQVEAEGWTPEHDDSHGNGELADAACCYAMPPQRRTLGWETTEHMRPWPWGRSWWKPGDRRRDLVKAGALIVAEIERLDRERDLVLKRSWRAEAGLPDGDEAALAAGDGSE